MCLVYNIIVEFEHLHYECTNIMNKKLLATAQDRLKSEPCLYFLTPSRICIVCRTIGHGYLYIVAAILNRRDWALSFPEIILDVVIWHYKYSNTTSITVQWDRYNMLYISEIEISHRVAEAAYGNVDASYKIVGKST